MVPRFALAFLFVPAVVFGRTLVVVSDSPERPYAFSEAQCTHGKSDLKVVLDDREGSLSLGFRNLYPRLESLKVGDSLAVTFTRDAELNVRFVDREVNRFAFSGRYQSRCELMFAKTSNNGLAIHGECRKLRPASEDGFNLGFAIAADAAIDCSL